MNAALVAALIFTVVLLVVTTYFLMGSVPLLILKHDTTLDSRFIGGFLKTYYTSASYTALATAMSYAFSGQFTLSVGAIGLAAVAATLKRTIIPKMESLRWRIEAGDSKAIAAFRLLHTKAIMINLTQLALIVWGLIDLSMQMR